MSGIYIHIPFCKQACSYCDFYFITRTTEREAFVNRLIDDIKGYHNSEFAEETIETIYFGGGTPSLLKPKEVEQILKALDEVFDLKTREITFEMNPDDVTAEFLADLKKIGINRASMGIQTFQSELLEFMNRAHSSEEALSCLEILSQSGFKSFTVDLIYGNPNQDLDQLNEDIDILLQFDPPHISAYSLTIEPRTKLGKQLELGRIAKPEDDKVANHFDLINERFHQHGIERYEVSNYSKPGQEAVHNSHYWEHKNYLGLGPGAHSFWWGKEAFRWENAPDLRGYIKGEKIRGAKEKLSPEQLAEERLLMGLRTRKGVAFKELEEEYNYRLNERQKKYLQERCGEGKVQFNENISLTDKGIKIADALILDLVTLH